MSPSFTQLIKYRHWSTWAFIFSFIVFLFSSYFLTFYVLAHSEQVNLAIIILVASLVVSATSLVALFVITHIALHKERRAQQHADLDAEKKKLW